MTIAYISVGSNSGDRMRNIERVLNVLKNFFTIKKISSLYETEPVGVVSKEWFVNGVVKLDTDMKVEQFMAKLKQIENSMGRLRNVYGGPIVIDLDILFFGDKMLDHQDLFIPHFRLHKRRFVLVPLVEVEPELIHPSYGKTVSQLLEELPNDKIVKKLE